MQEGEMKKSEEKTKRTRIKAVAKIIAATLGGGVIYNLGVNLYINSNAINISGGTNTIILNDWKSFVEGYNDLFEEYTNVKEENKRLEAQNEQYYTDYTEQKSLNESLTSEIDGNPDVTFNSLGLCIDGEQIPIDSTDSVVDINGREYWSKEIATKFLADSQKYSVENGNLNVGKVLADKTDLFGLFVNDSSSNSWLEAGPVVDSYNNSHSNVLVNFWYNQHITFVLNGKYSMLKISAAMIEKCSDSVTASFVIKAGDSIVYSSSSLSVKTEPYEVIDIPINNCNLLTIECNCNSEFKNLILYDAVVYN